MNILILSDLHIDTNDNFGVFQWDDMDFIMCIERIREKHNIEKIILNGDIYELLKYSFDDIKKARPALLNYLINRDFVYIKGNHDLVCDFGLEHYRIENSKGQIIYIEHGHNADWLNGKRIGRVVGRVLFSVLKKLSYSSLMMDLYFRIIRYNDEVNIIPKRYNTITYLTYALNLLKDNDVVILGHTHKLESHHTYYLNKKKRYLNCGSCSLGRFQGIVIDTETLKYELIKETCESMVNSYSYTYAV